MKLSRIIFIISFLVSLSSVAAPVPPDFTATYEVKKGYFKIGEAVRTLKKQEDGWLYTSHSKTTGFIAALLSTDILQTTKFNLSNGLIRPLIYTYNKNNGAHKVHQTYDWEKKKVFSQSGDKLHIYDIPEKVQDQSIYQLSMMLDLADGIKDTTYHVAENVRLMDYQIKSLGFETIDSELGKIHTKVMRVKTRKNKTTIWFSPKHHFLPIKIEFDEDGTTFLATLVKLKGF